MSYRLEYQDGELKVPSKRKSYLATEQARHNRYHAERRCTRCGKENDRFPLRRCSMCGDRNNLILAQWHERQRQDAFAAYGGRCVCCGMTDTNYFQIDHVNNNGNEHRREIRGNRPGNVHMVRWLKEHGYPEGFQILCANCHHAKSYRGGCQGEHPWRLVDVSNP